MNYFNRTPSLGASKDNKLTSFQMEFNQLTAAATTQTMK